MRRFKLKDGPRPHGQDGPWPQPLAQAGEQRREDDVEEEELGAAREWLRHVEAGRIGLKHGAHGVDPSDGERRHSC